MESGGGWSHNELQAKSKEELIQLLLSANPKESTERGEVQSAVKRKRVESDDEVGNDGRRLTVRPDARLTILCPPEADDDLSV